MFAFEVSYLVDVYEKTLFDTIYHEHLAYHSVKPLRAFMAANGMHLFAAERVDSHGGSLRVYAQRSGTGVQARTERLAAIEKREADAGIESLAFYDGFQAKAEKVKDDFVAFLIDAKRRGLKVGAYGAAAKGNTLMNFAGIRPDLIPYVVDRAAAKQGKYMPGSRIPIVGEAHLEADRPDIIVILPWNISGEVKRQLDHARGWGARFVTAVPELTVA